MTTFTSVYRQAINRGKQVKADLLTTVHQSWLNRRNVPLHWGTILLALLVAALRPH